MATNQTTASEDNELLRLLQQDLNNVTLTKSFEGTFFFKIDDDIAKIFTVLNKLEDTVAHYCIQEPSLDDVLSHFL